MGASKLIMEKIILSQKIILEFLQQGLQMSFSKWKPT